MWIHAMDYVISCQGIKLGRDTEKYLQYNIKDIRFSQFWN